MIPDSQTIALCSKLSQHNVATSLLLAVCPSGLQPTQIFWGISKGNLDVYLHVRLHSCQTSFRAEKVAYRENFSVYFV